MTSPSVVALIPARAGSKRIQNKNTRLFAGHPLIAYTISSALESGVFQSVIVSTDTEEITRIARYYGAEVPCLRPVEFAGDLSPDIEWVRDIFDKLSNAGRTYDAFAVLRPTSPFRMPVTIQRAWRQFLELKDVDSIRAVEKCKQHPGKMWVVGGGRMEPLLKEGPEDPPWHSTPYQALPPVYVQNASLEIAWCRVVDETRTISGKRLAPFFTEGYEGFDMNDPEDWWYAEHLLRSAEVKLPNVSRPGFPG